MSETKEDKVIDVKAKTVVYLTEKGAKSMDSASFEKDQAIHVSQVVAKKLIASGKAVDTLSEAKSTNPFQK